MDYRNLIRKTGEIFGLEEWEPDETGICFLIAEEAEITLMSCDPRQETLIITAGVIELPSECPKELLQTILDFNYQFIETQGASLALNKEESCLQLTLYVQLPSATPENLSKILEAFASTLLGLREKVTHKLSEVSPE